ncbi:DUF2970 domain-containing protein [Oxalobacteraceae bacterium R-40]|uniref:DUF2970 domain-containing protein n=1 Tax=Keguizhuia sedimenti TaxID=3064264 RepID=A0ABU1BJ42_9BURK|nr:DUF2970 domain-containing protein [Oxalobacteraceae bacterium R-40]
MQDDFKESTQRKASLGATVKAILWAFLGVRKKSGYEHDAAKLNPVHVLLAGVIAALIFIATLVIIVKIVVAQ